MYFILGYLFFGWMTFNVYIIKLWVDPVDHNLSPFNLALNTRAKQLMAWSIIFVIAVLIWPLIVWSWILLFVHNKRKFNET